MSQDDIFKWYDSNVGKIGYSMGGAYPRQFVDFGAGGYTDCSGGASSALTYAGFGDYNSLPSTVTLGAAVQRNGAHMIYSGGDFDPNNFDLMHRGDMLLLSEGKSMGDSGGAGGHVGFFTGNGNQLVSTTAYISQGSQAGQLSMAPRLTAVQYNALTDWLPVFNYYEIWRFDGGSANSGQQGENGDNQQGPNATLPTKKENGNRLIDNFQTFF